jgi:hypothetical protein
VSSERAWAVDPWNGFLVGALAGEHLPSSGADDESRRVPAAYYVESVRGKFFGPGQNLRLPNTGH